MNVPFIRVLARVPARQLNLALIATLVAAGALVWLFCMRTPLAALRSMQAEQSRLARAATDPAALMRQNASVVQEVAALSRSLGKDDVARSPDQFLVYLIGEVDRAGTRHRVELSGAKAAATRKAVIFDEIPFDIEATGSYQGLVDWMADIERSLPMLSIVSFEISPTDAPPQLAMKIRIAAYRQLEARL